ncbi:thiamine-phosphate kinase [Ectothiorhodospira haloalkaliphila]|uniref:thiamine-phosphate kinase n=1 Tax=Ectothiorhodospira haloalkaliphila TaxID=421628 RepID=UPI001EE7FA0D|nr:thiamine-phosphate kinase [Ectothiorhodospira haloalkaliphila]
MKEFNLIQRHFTPVKTSPDTLLGVGDDAAIIQPPAHQHLAVCVDTLVAGVHFPKDTHPRDIGHKALAVNLSDLAAMAATPRWATLALTLPEHDDTWLEAFAEGFYALARQHHVDLIGGDTTRGPLTITVQVMGHVPPDQALRRDGARPGDHILVTGTLGDAALALAQWDHPNPDPTLRARLTRPTPRIAAAHILRGRAHAGIDISDGLVQDLGHVLKASGLGATLQAGALPLSEAFRHAMGDGTNWQYPLAGGDDYELLFTLGEADVEPIREQLAGQGCPATVIGRIEAEPGLRVLGPDGASLTLEQGGYSHFGN